MQRKLLLGLLLLLISDVAYSVTSEYLLSNLEGEYLSYKYNKCLENDYQFAVAKTVITNAPGDLNFQISWNTYEDSTVVTEIYKAVIIVENTGTVIRLTPPELPFSHYFEFDRVGYIFRQEAIFLFGCENHAKTWFADSSLAKEKNQIYKWDVTPNPVNDFISIKSRLENVQPGTRIQLYNRHGQLVYSAMMTEISQRFEVPDLPYGLYLLQIHDDETRAAMQILKLKQH